MVDARPKICPADSLSRHWPQLVTASVWGQTKHVNVGYGWPMRSNAYYDLLVPRHDLSITASLPSTSSTLATGPSEYIASRLCNRQEPAWGLADAEGSAEDGPMSNRARAVADVVRQRLSSQTLDNGAKSEDDSC